MATRPSWSRFLAGAFALAFASSCDAGSTSLSSDRDDSNADKGNTGAVAAAATNTGLPCEVDAVLKTRCQTCHAATPKFGASTALVTWDDLQKPAPGGSGKKVVDLVKERIHDEARTMPPSPQAPLDAKALSTIDGWIGGGAKVSSTSCTNQGPEDPVKALPCKPDTSLKATTPFTMKPGGALDQYMCFGVDVKVDKKRHVTALAPIVDNKDLVHHILLFQTTKAESTEPFACEAFGSAAWQLVAGWAPGGNNLLLPPEAGFPEEKGTTHWVVQIHYNTTKTQTGDDRSGYELCTTDDLRANDASILAFGSTKFTIPPRANHKIRCDYRVGANIKVFNASPHMHTYGASMSTERIPGGVGTPEMVYEQKAFSFEAQTNNAISKDVKYGDVMRTRCGWKNTTDQSINFGEGTGDEMCFNFMGYYPKVPDLVLFGIPVFTWVTPSLTADCTAE